MPLLLRSLSNASPRNAAGAVRDRLPAAISDRLDAGLSVTRSAVRWGNDHALPSLAMRRAASRDDVQGLLITYGESMTPDEVGDLAARARASGPLHKGSFGRVATTVEGVREVLTSNDFRTGVFDLGPGRIGDLRRWAENDPPILGPITPPSLLVSEPPDHTRYRKLVTRVFSARAVEALRERTQQIADDLLDDMVRDAGSDGTGPAGVVDLVERYCSLLPVTVIAEILGVPSEDRDLVLELGGVAAPSLDIGLSWAEHRTVEAGLLRFDRWLDTHLKRLRDEPGDDLLSQLVAVRDEGRGLDAVELKATAGLVLAAGFETTVNLLGNGISLLARNPDQLARLRADPSLWSNTVDEVLRIDPPVLLTGRVSSRDTEVVGIPVAAGTVITTFLAGANRDPAVFPDPARFDVGRSNAGDHVSFSSGRHYCLGAALARMEGEVGLRSIFDRFPDLALAPGAERRRTRILRGWATLPAHLTPAR